MDLNGEKNTCPSCSMIMLQSIGSCREFLEMPGQPECSGELPQAKQAACPCRAPVISPKQCFAMPWAPRPMGRIEKRYQNVPSPVPSDNASESFDSAGFGSQRALAVDFRNRRCRGKQGGELQEMTCQ